MKKHSELTKDELSLILFFECAAVDYGGKVDIRRMNADDFKIAEKWNKEGFVEFERIAFKSLTNDNKTYAVFLSDSAWEIAHYERRARCKRLTEKTRMDNNKRKGMKEETRKTIYLLLSGFIVGSFLMYALDRETTYEKETVLKIYEYGYRQGMNASLNEVVNNVDADSTFVADFKEFKKSLK